MHLNTTVHISEINVQGHDSNDERRQQQLESTEPEGQQFRLGAGTQS